MLKFASGSRSCLSTLTSPGLAAMSPETVAMIKATAPVVAPHALTITKTFYPLMFKNNPEALFFFNRTNQARGRQPEALANAVIAYASNIDNLGVLGGAVDMMAHKHCGLMVFPEHYSIVHKNLMLAIGQVLGPAVTAPVAAAWSEAVTTLADILIKREAELYTVAASRRGGWRNWKSFKVTEKTQVAQRVFEYRFKPAALHVGSQGAAFDFEAGQFLSLHFPDAVNGNPRHYTVTSAPGADHLAISVKTLRAPPGTNHPVGVVSNRLANMKVGDTVELAPPFGGFTLRTPKDRNVLLLSAGIGSTATRAILRAAKSRGNKTLSIHADKSEHDHAFGGVFKAEADAAFEIFEEADTTFSPKGLISDFLVKKALASEGWNPASTDAYVCGPEGYMTKVAAILNDVGVKAVHSEAFGPQLATKFAL